MSPPPALKARCVPDVTEQVPAEHREEHRDAAHRRGSRLRCIGLRGTVLTDVLPGLDDEVPS